MNFRLILPLTLLLAGPAPGITAAPPAPAPPATTEPTAPPPMKLPPERAETRRGKALEEQLKQIDRATEITWLGSGDDKYLALYLPDHSGRTFANLLILPDNLQHPDWPGVVRTLRREMAAHGWNTLAIATPDYLPKLNLPPLPAPMPDTSAPAATDTKGKAAAKPGTPADAGNAPAGAPPEPEKSVEYAAEDIPKILNTRVTDAIGYMKQKNPGPVVVVAVGLAAGIMAKEAQTMLIKDIAGVVLIDPSQPPGSNFNTDLDAMDLRIPVLDIVPQFNPHTDPVLRRNNAERIGQKQYQQRIIMGAGPDFEGMEPIIVKAILGWGKRNFKP